MSDSIYNQSGGNDLAAGRDITIGGDVVGRDKIVSNTYNTGDQQYDVRSLANPYLGLQSFTYADHAKYAGREKLIAETVAHITAPDEPLALLFVTGASGSGKSSFVQAGVLPELEKHYAALSVKWAVFRPSRDPLAALADALWRQLGLPQFDPSMASPADFGDSLKTHTPPQQVNVIVIDQFEELFTQSNAQPRGALFHLLTQLPPFRETRTHIIATVRADYLPELFALPTLYDIAKHGIDLRAMSVDELREAIQQPLRATYPNNDKFFQPELVERLAQDTAVDAAYLPLLQVTLEETWRKGVLTVGSFTNLAEAIKQRADKVLEYQDYDAAQPSQPRPPEEQAAILNLCLDLVDVSLDDEARRDVRRRRSKDELVNGAPDRARLIDALTQARLLSVEAEPGEQLHVEVDLIHETLLSNWDRLRQAIADRRNELRQRARFEQQLQEWIGQGRADDYLLSGVYLAEARELERHDDIALRNADAKDFVHRSVERAEAERQKDLDDARKLTEAERLRAEVQTQSAAKLRRRAIYLGGALVAALIAVIVAVTFGIQSQKQARLALSRQLAAEASSYLNDQLDRSLLLSLGAYQLENTVEARSSLLTGLQRDSRLKTFLHGHKSPVKSVAFSSDGATLATSDWGGTIMLWNAQTGRSLGPPLTGQAGIVLQVAFGADGETLASGSSDATIYLWDVRTHLQIGTPLSGHKQPVLTVAFSSDGKTLASGSEDKTIILWDIQSHRMLVSIPAGHTDFDFVNSVAFSPDGKTLVAGMGGGDILLWDVSNPLTPIEVGKPFTTTSGVNSVAFNPDGTILASGGADSAIRLWDAATRQPLGTPILGHTAAVNSVAFSPDGTELASGGEDSTVRLWSVQTQQQLGSSLTGHRFAVLSVAFSSDGHTLASGNYDHTVILWDVTSRQPLGEPLSDHVTEALRVTFSPDGKSLAAGTADNSIILWDVASRQHLGALSHPGAVFGVAFSPDSRMLASGSSDRTVILWDVSNPKAPTQLGVLITGLADSRVVFSPDGKTLAASGYHKTILWDVSNPRAPVQLSQPLTDPQVFSIAFSPDGRTLALSNYPSGVILWDVSNPRAPVQLGELVNGHNVEATDLAFSPDGRTLATGNVFYHTIILWNVSNPKAPVQLGEPLTDPYVSSVAFSPDGKTLASSSYGDGTIILWDVSNLKIPVELGAPLIGRTNWVWSVAFSPDGKTLASGDADGAIILWDVDPVSWQARACQIAGRNLTRAEWQQYMGDEPYRKTCEQWPLEPEATPTSAP